MPKMKTHRGAAKRFARTAGGKIKRRRACHSHLLTKKTKQRKRRLRSAALIDSSDRNRIERMLPYR